MAATFNPALDRPIDWVRHYIGDKNLQAPLVQDETITALLATSRATVLRVSLSLARGILAEYAHKVTYDVDGQGQRFSDLVKGYQVVVDGLAGLVAAETAAAVTEDQIAASQAMGGGIMPRGLSVRENIRTSEDTDRAANYSASYDGL